MKCIRYADGYRFQLRRTCSIQTDIKPATAIFTPWIRLDTDGLLTITEGYAWDGASGRITVQTKSWIRPSLAHDALYQLLRLGLLPAEVRVMADDLMYRLCLEDGMLPFRAWYSYHAVRLFGNPAADPANIAPDECAPCDCQNTTQTIAAP